MKRVLFALAVSSAVIAVDSPCRAEPYRPRVGQRHPDFILPALGDRQPVSLSQFHGKKVLLIHFASW
jgi:hypothetical protein